MASVFGCCRNMGMPLKHTYDYNCPIVSRGLSLVKNDCHLEEAITFHRDLAVFVNGVARRHEDICCLLLMEKILHHLGFIKPCK